MLQNAQMKEEEKDAKQLAKLVKIIWPEHTLKRINRNRKRLY